MYVILLSLIISFYFCVWVVCCSFVCFCSFVLVDLIFALLLLFLFFYGEVLGIGKDGFCERFVLK